MYMKSTCKKSMGHARKDTLLPDFESLFGGKSSLQMKPFVQNDLCVGTCVQPMLHGLLFKWTIRDLDPQIRAFFDKFDFDGVLIGSWNA